MADEPRSSALGFESSCVCRCPLSTCGNERAAVVSCETSSNATSKLTRKNHNKSPPGAGLWLAKVSKQYLKCRARVVLSSGVVGDVGRVKLRSASFGFSSNLARAQSARIPWRGCSSCARRSLVRRILASSPLDRLGCLPPIVVKCRWASVTPPLPGGIHMDPPLPRMP